MTIRLLLLAATFALAGCATPLGPGFRAERQGYELRLVPEAPARMEVRAAYRLRNVGNAPLLSLAVRLPGADSLGRRNFRARIDGREVAPHTPADAAAGTIEIPFSPPWPQGQRCEVVLEYELAPAAPGHAGLSIGENSAHLRHYGWFPDLLPPEALFAKGGNAPQKMQVSIYVPEGFHVLSSGRSRGTRRSAGGVEHRFELRSDDFDSFLVAGRYSEARFDTRHGDVIFWTFQPVDHDVADSAAERIAVAHHAFVEAFGRIPHKPQTVYVVESPARLTPRTGGPDGPAGIGFPFGALVNSSAVSLGLTSDAFLGLVEHELAHAWFGLSINPRRESELLLSEALAEYATVVAAEARDGEPARRHRAALLLRWYDESRARAPEKSLDALRPTDPWPQRAFAYSKGALFFVALEDEIGKEALHRGLARMVHALRGRDDAGVQDLRAALEGESGRDLAEFFRSWLFETGMPADFRAKYEVKMQ